MADFLKDLRVMGSEMHDFIKRLPDLAGAEVMDSIDQNFRDESFFGQAWEPRKVQEGNEGKAILVQTGRLRRSFKLQTSGLVITIFTDTPYAEIHNEGGMIEGTVDVAAYERHQYEMNEVSKPGSRKEKWKKEKVSTGQVKAHTREVSTEIPQRQFMGPHPELDRKIEKLITTRMDNIFEG
ncbi:MAG: phage virion morphogenesis protein [Pseudomonadota bacterium]